VNQHEGRGEAQPRQRGPEATAKERRGSSALWSRWFAVTVLLHAQCDRRRQLAPREQRAAGSVGAGTTGASENDVDGEVRDEGDAGRAR